MGEAEAALVDEKQVDLGVLPTDESVIWSQEVEVCLFHAMLGHKPVGVNRHFHMICIREKFSQNIGRQVSSKVIWDHLGTMYDMQALDESEILPFPNSEKCFVLPEEIIQEVKEGKLELEQESKEDMKEERDSPSAYEEGLGPSLARLQFERQCCTSEGGGEVRQQGQGPGRGEGLG
ncbi:MRG/MORF4L-binding protein-like isoform X2 [Brienomyrus brachyistius]|uniref:MRG/MORF4L-binding protein-like isoform X2 n=1 Tax=Brienomyrus brachyistius TaxID=42636 RepID=UPI0020B3EB2A|nr:MRG/MORF4L-binding protein-like isoform X2 [Brienomyrus brachyistius]